MEARRKLIEPYLRPAWKYLLSATRDPDKADDLLGEFCLRFMNGAFHLANSHKGELGLMMKTALAHMVIEFAARECRRHSGQSLPESIVSKPNDDRDGVCDPYRVEARAGVLDLAWEKMAAYERDHLRTWHYTVLRLRTLYPDDTYHELSLALSPLMDRRLTPNAVKILVHHARQHFIECLLQTVQETIGFYSYESTREFLRELGLWTWCQGQI